MEQDQQGQLTPTCPTCHQVTSIPASGVEGLPADFRVNQLLENVEDATAKPATANLEGVENTSPTATACGSTNIFCPDHSEKIELFCETCGEAICFKCTLRGGKHQKHNFEELHTVTETTNLREDTLMLAITANQVETLNTSLGK